MDPLNLDCSAVAWVIELTAASCTYEIVTYVSYLHVYRDGDKVTIYFEVSEYWHGILQCHGIPLLVSRAFAQVVFSMYTYVHV